VGRSTVALALVGLALAFGAAARPVTAAPTGLVRGCGYAHLQRPFLRWLDLGRYVLVPGGSFENGAAGWMLAGGAAVVDGNEPFDLDGSAGTHALSLPADSSATTPPVCVGLLTPTLRFVAANGGSLLAPLRVEAIVLGPSGPVATVPLLPVVGSSAWMPTLPLPILVDLTQLPVVTDGTLEVAFRFTAAAGSAWRIDDTYVDPYQGR